MRQKLSAATLFAGVVAVLLAGCAAPEPQGSATSAPQDAVSDSSAMATTLAYIDAGLPDLEGASLAYLVECATQNSFCQTRWDGAQDAAEAAGAEITLFDAGFDPNAQLAQAQDAILRDFDGYILSPVADASGCATFELLQATGKPVVNINSPMCGNADFTDGTAGFVAMQTESFFLEHVENAFSLCEGECEAIAVGGFVGSDLFTRWENAIQRALESYPNVTVVSNQPGNFDPAVALTVVQDALLANPDAEIVVSSWDDMTRGVEEGVRAAGMTPGDDVRIYSVGGTEYGVGQVEQGSWDSTTILLPYEESYYGVVQLARAIETGEPTPGFTYLAESPLVLEGPGSLFITVDNADGFTPEY
ncbi:sugar ABC transporter substrate-binding protein [Microcella daejeonensis]|uniref:sugar ABC transporter substrate-binding protein n=1 Tax=Microcella daejeonensis TaxID=2994971 RepID=UPI0022705FA1|nr:sugar ABC transporter substrate-binding protein [Microcella daejeonensis]WAB83830.1 sugar ABC transporter substrate-binding protein [Microcella daejeonensis]